MDDFTKCMGLNCPIRQDCLRYKQRQKEDYYLTESPYNKKTKDCDLFWGEIQEDFYNQLIEITKPSN